MRTHVVPVAMQPHQMEPRMVSHSIYNTWGGGFVLPHRLKGHMVSLEHHGMTLPRERYSPKYSNDECLEPCLPTKFTKQFYSAWEA